MSMGKESEQGSSPLRSEGTAYSSSASEALGKAFALPEQWRGAHEVVVEQQVQDPINLPTDDLEAIERRALIAYHAYGRAATGRIAAFLGVDKKEVNTILERPSVKALLRSGAIPCWTGAEIIARLSVEAECAQRPQDRIVALKLLMEYRSMSQPEGGSRSFKRIAAKFARPA